MNILDYVWTFVKAVAAFIVVTAIFYYIGKSHYDNAYEDAEKELRSSFFKKASNTISDLNTAWTIGKFFWGTLNFPLFIAKSVITSYAKDKIFGPEKTIGELARQKRQDAQTLMNKSPLIGLIAAVIVGYCSFPSHASNVKVPPKSDSIAITQQTATVTDDELKKTVYHNRDKEKLDNLINESKLSKLHKLLYKSYVNKNAEASEGKTVEEIISASKEHNFASPLNQISKLYVKDSNIALSKYPSANSSKGNLLNRAQKLNVLNFYTKASDKDRLLKKDIDVDVDGTTVKLSKDQPVTIIGGSGQETLCQFNTDDGKNYKAIFNDADLATIGEENWYYVDTGTSKGYIAQADTISNTQGIITRDNTDIRKEPGNGSSSLGVFYRGDIVKIVGVSKVDGSEWYKVEYNNPDVGLITGFVNAKYIDTNVPAINMNAISKTMQTSADKEGNYVHSAALTIDGNIASCWTEGVEGLGVGESLSYNFNGTYKVSGIDIWIGHQKSTELFYQNARPTAIKVQGSDGYSKTFNLKDEKNVQHIQFEKAINVNSITLTVENATPGSKYADTCIAEVKFF